MSGGMHSNGDREKKESRKKPATKGLGKKKIGPPITQKATRQKKTLLASEKKKQRSEKTVVLITFWKVDGEEIPKKRNKTGKKERDIGRGFKGAGKGGKARWGCRKERRCVVGVASGGTLRGRGGKRRF